MSGVGSSTPPGLRAFLPPPERPGNVLRTRFKALGKSTQADLADALGVSRVTANELLNHHRAISAVMALRLARIFDTTAEYWMDLQRDWDLHVAWSEFGREIEALPPIRVAQRAEDMTRPIAEIAAEARRGRGSEGPCPAAGRRHA